MSVATAVTTSKKESQETIVEQDVFYISDIPGAMKKMGWKVAPQLMQHWLDTKPDFSFNETTKREHLAGDARKIDSSRINDNIVTMSWAREYEQVLEGVKSLTNEWCTKNAIALLKKKLQEAGDYKLEPIYIGYTDDVKVLDATAQVNYKRIGALSDTINDWYGAMGNSNLKVCVQGYTKVVNGQCKFIVKRLGFYLKDTYDFLEDSILGIDIPEPLGIWSKNGVLNKAETLTYLSRYNSEMYEELVIYFKGYVPVFNSDFRKWQNKHKAGGDFLIFSDVYWCDPLDNHKEILL